MSSTVEQTTIGVKSDSTPAAAPIVLTEKAAKEVKKIIADQVAAGETRALHLRMRVVGGGCSGFQHKLDLDPAVNPKLDDTFELHGVPVVIDRQHDVP
jgi:iron-sulfur cluster assembly protein